MELTKRKFLAGVAAVAASQRISVGLAQEYKAGGELPALVMESYPDAMTVEIVRLYARELEKLGIRVVQRPLNYGQILGKVYGQKNLAMAMMGLGFPEDRLDPDFFIRAVYATGGSFNIPHYSNPEYDKYAQAQLTAQTKQARTEALHAAQKIFADELPSWPVCSRDAINPVNTELFKNYKPSRGFGLECYHVAPYLEVEPTGSVREINVASTYRLSSAHLFTERSANGRGYLRFIYDTFLRYDGDLNLIPWAAEKVNQVDSTTYEIVLRSGMKWHDGQPVTIEDAKFTFDYLLKWNPPLWQPLISPIASAEISGDRTLRVKLKSPSATFTTISLAQITIIPKHVWEKAGTTSPLDWDAPGTPGGMIGSGPFKFVRFEKDVDCHIAAYREHWTGGPKIDGVHYIQAASIEQMVGGMEAGTIHVIGDGITIVEGKRLAQKPNIKLLTTETGTIVSFWMDSSKAPFNNRLFRHALYHAMPKAMIAEIAVGGASTPARRTPLPPLMKEWIPDNTPGDEYDIQKAQRLLAQAGFKRQGPRLIAP
jgi:peptide/nickel transport system substrate-binding protein